MSKREVETVDYDKEVIKNIFNPKDEEYEKNTENEKPLYKTKRGKK